MIYSCAVKEAIEKCAEDDILVSMSLSEYHSAIFIACFITVTITVIAGITLLVVKNI